MASIAASAVDGEELRAQLRTLLERDGVGTALLPWIDRTRPGAEARRRDLAVLVLSEGRQSFIVSRLEQPLILPTDGLSPLFIAAPERAVERLCAGRDAIDEYDVDELASIQTELELPPAFFWAPLLRRNLTGGARRRVWSLLGATPGAEAAQLLASEAERHLRTAASKTVRLELMRQSTLPVVPITTAAQVWWQVAPGPCALPSPRPRRMQGTPAAEHDLLHLWWPLAAGGGLLFEVTAEECVTVRGYWSDAPPTPEGAAALSAGQLATLLSSWPETHRRGTAVLEALLRSTPASSLPASPRDAASLEPSRVRAMLAQHPVPGRPLAMIDGWSASTLSACAQVEPEAWPASIEQVDELASRRLEQLLSSRPTVSRVLAAWRRRSQLMAALGHPLASLMASDGLHLAQRRVGVLATELAVQELARQLVEQAALPPSWLAALERSVIDHGTPADRVAEVCAAIIAPARTFAGPPTWRGLPTGEALMRLVADHRA